MARGSKRSTSQPHAAAAQPAIVRDPTRGRSPRKKPTNLSLDPAALDRGIRYGAIHGQKVSQLVNAFLAALPTEDADESVTAELSPAVRRLYGVAAGGPERTTSARDDYRAYQAGKYGSGTG